MREIISGGGGAMIAEKELKHKIFVCPHCKGTSFIFLGMQRQKGLFKGRELWNCKTCHSTFAREAIDVNNLKENTSFNSKTFPFYYKARFSC